MGRKVEVIMRSSPPVRPPCSTVHSHLGGAGCLISPFIGTSTSIPLVLPPSTPSTEEQSSTAAPPTPTPKQSPRLKRWLPSPELMGNMPLGGATLVAMLGGPPNPKKWENPPWFRLLKPSHAEAFLRDSDIVVEARLHLFSKHSYKFNQDGNCDLSGIFKKLAVSVSLLGTNIHEIEASWKGLRSWNKQIILCSPYPKVWNSLGSCPPQNLQSSWV